MTVLPDTSAWVEYLRSTKSPVCLEMRRLLRHEPRRVVMASPVAMELLAGPTSHLVVVKLETLIDGLPQVALIEELDFRAAAAAARAVRRRGDTVRSIVDCLVAAIALRTQCALLHQDRDFTLLGQALPDLVLHPVPA